MMLRTWFTTRYTNRRTMRNLLYRMILSYFLLLCRNFHVYLLFVKVLRETSYIHCLVVIFLWKELKSLIVTFFALITFLLLVGDESQLQSSIHSLIHCCTCFRNRCMDREYITVDIWKKLSREKWECKLRERKRWTIISPLRSPL